MCGGEWTWTYVQPRGWNRRGTTLHEPRKTMRTMRTGRPIRGMQTAIRGRMGKTVRVAAQGEPVDQDNPYYEVLLEKPIGVKFNRGKDGGAYVAKIDESIGNVDEKFELGDKIVAISASFGPDIWPAENYGQIMYAIKTRNGGVYFKMEKKYGDLSFMEKPDNDLFKKERAGGNYGAGTKEMQQKNYEKRKELANRRKKDFQKGLDLFNQKKYEDALIVWEDVLGQEPPNYMGDRFERVTDVYLATQYNIACCYAYLGKVDEGLDALEDVLFCGFDDYKKVRNDPNLAGLRDSERFTPMINKYDEPWINENALKALKGIFGK